jgi:hypothetical protein
MHGESLRMLKEVVVACLKLLQHLIEGSCGKIH